MALGTVVIQETYDESPRLTYRARTRDASVPDLEVFAEELTVAEGNSRTASSEASSARLETTRTAQSTTDSSPRVTAPSSLPSCGEW